MNLKPKNKNTRNSGISVNTSPIKNKRASNIINNTGLTPLTNEKESNKNIAVYDKNSKMKATSKILETYKKLKVENISQPESNRNDEPDVVVIKKIETESKENEIKKVSLLQQRENFLKELKQNIRVRKQKESAESNTNANILSNSLSIRDKKSSINLKKQEGYINTSFDKYDLDMIKEVVDNKDKDKGSNLLSSARNGIWVNSLKNQKDQNRSKVKNSLIKGVHSRDTSVKVKKPSVFNLNIRNSLLASNYDSDGMGNNKLNVSLNHKNSLLKTNIMNVIPENSSSNLTPKRRNLPFNNLRSIQHNKIEELYKSKEDSEFFDYEDEKKEELTADEKAVYGNREPKDYKKIKLIGKGGCGVVWLCVDKEGNEYAVKQIAKKANGRADSLRESSGVNMSTIIARKELEILNCLNSSNENEKYMVLLKDYIEDNSDIWFILEKGGKSLSNLIFKIKGEFLGNERIYSIKKGKFLVHLFEDINNFKKFIRQLLTFINFLNSNGIVHCDIKPENILIDYSVDNEGVMYFNNVKMIDFGSAFFISNPENFNSNTPEYMSPEITDLIERNASAKDTVSFLRKLQDFPWCVDIWSLGVTILEMVLSCPLWMSYKAKVVIHGKVIYKSGLFGVKGRNGSKIHTKQIEVASSIPKLMNESLVVNEEDRSLLTDLLTKMLDLNYKSRISPLDALNHPFLSN